MELFFTVNGTVNYVDVKEAKWLEYEFDDSRFEIIVSSREKMNSVSKTFVFTPEDYAQVKFLFQNYLTKNGASLNATEVWDDHERVLRQTKELLELSKDESDIALQQRRLKVIENREDLVEYERWLKSGRGKMMGGNDSGPRILN